MVNLKNNKGITLVAQVITITVFLMIVGVISYSSVSSLQSKNLNDMYTDIVSIQEKVANYYLKYGEAPVDKSEGPVPNTIIDKISKNPNDEGDYYKVDISKLLNLTLNNAQTNENYYFMNENTLTTYYTKGVAIQDLKDEATGKRIETIYYTLPSNYEQVEKIEVQKYQN